MTPVLETSRLLLRPLVLEDAVAAQPLFNDWEVVKHLHAKSIPWPLPTDACETYYRDYLLPEMQAGRTCGWAIIEKASQNLIGVLQLAPADKHDSRGFWLGTAYHRKGYITESIVATTDYGFDVLKMECMLLNNAQPNIASRRVKEKAGAEFVETVPDYEYVGGKFPQEQWRLTPEQWRASPMKRAAANPSYTLR